MADFFIRKAKVFPEVLWEIFPHGFFFFFWSKLGPQLPLLHPGIRIAEKMRHKIATISSEQGQAMALELRVGFTF